MRVARVLGTAAITTMSVVGLAAATPAGATALAPNGSSLTTIAHGPAMIGAAGGTVQVTASIVCGVLAHGPCSGVVAELRLTDATGAVHTSRAVGHSVAAGSTSVQTFRFPVTGVAGAVVRYTGTVSFDTCGNDLTDNCIELTDTSPAATASAVA